MSDTTKPNETPFRRLSGDLIGIPCTENAPWFLRFSATVVIIYVCNAVLYRCPRSVSSSFKVPLSVKVDESIPVALVLYRSSRSLWSSFVGVC